MKTIHFVYSVPYPQTKDFFLRIFYKAFKILGLPPPYRNGNPRFIAWPKPIFAPNSITYFVLNALSKHYKVKLYHLQETTDVQINDEDVLLLHLYPSLVAGKWAEVDKNTVGYKLMRQKKGAESFLLAPYNHDIKQVGWLRDTFSQNPHLKFITICGQHWYESWDQSPLKDVLPRENVLQVNMGINPTDYPFLKRRFSPKGERKFLYIGRTNYPKNISALEDIALKIKNFQGGYISDGEIRGWKKISNSTHLTKELIETLSEEYDFFLSTSEFDAQATTVLEQMCIGLIVACTPESGLNYPTIIKLDKNDNAFNCKQIEIMQQIEESELLETVQANRKIAEEHHSWSQICGAINEFISNKL